MQQSARLRKVSIFSDSLHKSLNAYTLAASAAGVGLLTAAQPASAKIIYTPVHHIIGRNGHYHLNLNHDKLPDFSLVNSYFCNTDYCVDVLSALASGGNAVLGMHGFLGIPYAYALTRGNVIGPKQPFSGQLMASSQSGQGTIGRWLNVNNGYLGLRFVVKDKVHYGWARMSVKVYGGALIKTTVTGFAYETIANKPIIAGKTKGSLQSTTLGALAGGRISSNNLPEKKPAT
jgi:hypothetical protein